MFNVCLLHSQDSSAIKQPTVGLHFFYNDFETVKSINASNLMTVLKNNKWNTVNNMEGGFGIDYLQGINKNIDLVGTFNGSWVDYLLPSGTLYGSSNFLLDISAGGHLKLFSDNSIISPFLITKLNYTSYKNINGFSLIPGVGLQFCLFKESFVLATIEYRSALSNLISSQFYYSVGFATNIITKKQKPVKVLPTPIPVKEVIIPAKDIVISVTDEATNQPLPYVEVSLSGPEGKKFYGSTDANGKVTFNQLSASDYSVQGILNNINTTAQKINKTDFESNEQNIQITITHNDPRFTLSGIVINKTKNIPFGGAEISVNNLTQHSITTKLSKAGDGTFMAQLESESDFTVVGKKADYISNIEKVTTKGLNRSTILYVKLELGIEEAKVGQSIVLNNIYFEIKKTTINTAYSTDLDKLIQFLKDNPETKLEIQGHTDNTGSLAINNKLSQARAQSVVDYLTKNGIASNRLNAKGYGPTVPLFTNTTVEGRQKNRRVEMKVVL